MSCSLSDCEDKHISFNEEYFLKATMRQCLLTLKSKAQDRMLFIPCTTVTFRKQQRIIALTQIWVSFLGVCLEVVGGGQGVGGVKLLPKGC